MQLSEIFFSHLPKNITYKSTKFFTVFADESDKKAYFSGKRLQLLEFDSSFGKEFVQITEEEAKQKHLGKVRCLGIIRDEYELIVVFSKYFKFSAPPAYSTPQKQKTFKVKKIKTQKFVIDLKTELLPNDRDEKDLILSYRNAVTQRERNRIFNIVLFQRGVNGKTWDRIIRNYVSYNRHKFAHFLDRTENDFYQDIVIAFHKQIAKWFDPTRDICFSTYAWYVINCSFNRVLQLLSTQKRKVGSLKNNVELNDHEAAWDESISTEKTQSPQLCFEDELEQKNLCECIQKMFELKDIHAPEYLKQEILQVIREKSTMQNSLYSIAKKYKIDIDYVFKLEIALRENLKNSMYKDILLNMQYDINNDEDIAEKYRRSKGHVIKMKRQLSAIVKTKLKGITF